MTEQETINLKEVIYRYKIWRTQGVYNSTYYLSYGHWKKEIDEKISELEAKLKQLING